MSETQRFLGWAIIVSSTLYVALCFTAGIVEANRPARDLAIATAGACYIAYWVQLLRATAPDSALTRRALEAKNRFLEFLSAVAVGASIVWGVAAGGALLLR
jgi:hypothetical protein